MDGRNQYQLCHRLCNRLESVGRWMFRIVMRKLVRYCSFDTTIDRHSDERSKYLFCHRHQSRKSALIRIYGTAEFIRDGKTVNTVNSCDMYEFDADEKVIEVHSYCNSKRPN